MKHVRMMERAFNRPLMLEAGYARYLFAYLASRQGLGALQIDGELIEDTKSFADSYQNLEKRISVDERGRKILAPYALHGNVAVISAEGTLVQKMGQMEPYSGMQGYDGLKAKFVAAENDPMVKGHILEADSGGGEVAGCFEFANFLSTLTKPVWAYSNEFAASAMYALSSQAERIFVNENSSVGSIGVLTAHVDMSKALADNGRVVTLVYSGAHKVDGNPYAALPEDVHKKMQSDIDKIRGRFAGVVAKGRGDRMSIAQALATEARMYTGQDAVDVGLADQIASFDEAVSLMNIEVNKPKTSVFLPPLKGDFMTTETQVTGLTEADVQARIDAAVTAAKAQGITEGAAQAANDERARISAIVTSPHAVGREKLAHKMAFAMGMSSADAISLLEDAPVAQAPIEAKPSGADADAILLEQLAKGAEATTKDVIANAKEQAAEFALMAGVPTKRKGA